MHDFDVKNRLEGDLAFVTVSVLLSVSGIEGTVMLHDSDQASRM
jgi:hypothetical protein